MPTVKRRVPEIDLAYRLVRELHDTVIREHRVILFHNGRRDWQLVHDPAAVAELKVKTLSGGDVALEVLAIQIDEG